MTEATEGQHRHFLLEGVTETEAYRYPGGGDRGSAIPERDRVRHGGALRGQIEGLRGEAESAREAQQDAGMENDLGLQVEFDSFPDVEMAFESLARERSGIELLNVRHEENRTLATVFVPDGKLDHFESLIRDYLAEKRDKAGRLRDNRRLIDAIQQIRTASLRALWTDAPEIFPTTDEGSVWWEVWLPVRHDRVTIVESFRERAQAQGIEIFQGELIFPERTVLLVRASVEQMQHSMVTLNSIAELRGPKETAEFFDSLPPDEQVEWLNDLLSQTRFAPETGQTPYVCQLDTGNRSVPWQIDRGRNSRRLLLTNGGVGWRQQRGRRLLTHGGLAGPHEIVEDVALLLAQGIPHREQALYEAAAFGTVGAEAGMTPQHAMAKRSFGFVVGRLDAGPAYEGPQGRSEIEEVSAGGRRLGVGELLTIPQVIMKPSTQAADVDLEAGPLQGAVADPVPPGKHLIAGVQQPLPDPGGLSASGHELLEGAPQMSPADLAASKRQMPVGRIAIGADHRPVIRTQHLVDSVPSPAFSKGEHRDALGHRGPQPGLGAALPPAGLVDVDDALSANEGACLLDRPRQGRSHLLFQSADRTQRHLEAERVGQQRPDIALAQPVGPGQQAHPGLHAGTEGVPRYALGPTGFAQAVAVAATQGVQLILDDLGP